MKGQQKVEEYVEWMRQFREVWKETVVCFIKKRVMKSKSHEFKLCSCSSVARN